MKSHSLFAWLFECFSRAVYINPISIWTHSGFFKCFICVLAGPAVSYAARGPSSEILGRTGTETHVDRLPGPEPSLSAHAPWSASFGQGMAWFLESMFFRSKFCSSLTVSLVGSDGCHILGVEPQDVQAGSGTRSCLQSSSAQEHEEADLYRHVVKLVMSLCLSPRVGISSRVPVRDASGSARHFGGNARKPLCFSLVEWKTPAPSLHRVWSVSRISELFRMFLPNESQISWRNVQVIKRKKPVFRAMKNIAWHSSPFPYIF